MKKYKATADVLAQPMTSDEAYNEGYISEEDSQPNAEGYIVNFYVDNKPYSIWLSEKVFKSLFSLADTHLERMSIEYNQLADRIEALDNFLVREDAEKIVGKVQLHLLRMQYKAMAEYSHILSDRMVLKKL